MNTWSTAGLPGFIRVYEAAQRRRQIQLQLLRTSQSTDTGETQGFPYIFHARQRDIVHLYRDGGYHSRL